MLFAGAVVGAVFVARRSALARRADPGDRTRRTRRANASVREETTAAATRADQAAAFSGWLFTHNIEVSFVVVRARHHLRARHRRAALLQRRAARCAGDAVPPGRTWALFFWAWILPHGIPELTEVAIAGGAGLIVARGLWLPGRRRRRDALAAEATHRRGTRARRDADPGAGGRDRRHDQPDPRAGPALRSQARVRRPGRRTALYYYLLRAGRDPAARSPGASS